MYTESTQTHPNGHFSNESIRILIFREGLFAYFYVPRNMPEHQPTFYFSIGVEQALLSVIR